MNGIIAAIYASFLLAIGETSLKKSFRDFVPSVGYFMNAVTGLLVLTPISLLLGGSYRNFLHVLPYAIISAILSEAFYFYALSKGQLSITSILLSTYPIYTIAFSYFINGERISSKVWPFVITAILGTLLSYLPSKLSKRELIASQALVWPLLAALAAGFADTIAKRVINQTSSFDFLLALSVVQIPVGLVYLKLEKQNIKESFRAVQKRPGDYFHAIAGGFISIIGTGLLWVSFNYVDASIASPIISTSGALIVLFATLFMDEKMSWRNAFGVVMIFIGVMGIARTVGV
jgi:drug/metabolite transporter (DMT)-like permease